MLLPSVCASYGMRTQPQPLTLKTQAWSVSGQAPLQSGESASPQGTLPHSHDAVPTTARHFLPGAQVPEHAPLS